MEHQPQQKHPSLLDRLLGLLARQDTAFGSDIYVSYTHQYVWQANQFGHALIGLAVVLIASWFSCSPEWALLGVVVIYGLKELIDFLIAVRLAEGVFPVNRREAALDGVTDFGFVALGGLIGYAMAPAACVGRLTGFDAVPAGSLASIGSWPALGAIVGIVAFFLIARRPYLRKKRSFDKSNLPHFVRLPTFPDNFAVPPGTLPALAERILALATEAAQTSQIVVTGPARSGRTTLGLAIGGEATAALRRVRYLSATRLAEKAQAPFELESAPEQPYAVGEATLVVVDEIAGPVLSGDPAAALAEMVEARWHGGTTTVFQRPLAPRPADPLEEPAIPPGAQPRPTLPAIVWIIDDEVAAPGFLAALQARFPDAAIELVTLRGPLARLMRPDT
ncbi:MAG: hypothetical protein AB7P52_03475 [Alphaproteobacteria bacterium]